MAERRGSSVSDKQVAHAVDNNIPITFRIIGTGNPMHEVCGWVCGMDDFHWSVVDEGGQTRLVHKTTAIVEPHREAKDPPDAVDEIVAPFRNYIRKNVYGRATNAPES